MAKKEEEEEEEEGHDEAYLPRGWVVHSRTQGEKPTRAPENKGNKRIVLRGEEGEGGWVGKRRSIEV